MALPEILEKLNCALSGAITEECHVVYILSRIRKILETNGQKAKYRYLNFYCNWSLHSLIDRTEPVAEVLRDFIDDKDDHRFLRLEHFHSDLRNFIKEYELLEDIFAKGKYLALINLLVDVCLDTPVRVMSSSGSVRTITIFKPVQTISKSVFDISFRIE